MYMYVHVVKKIFKNSPKIIKHVKILKNILLFGLWSFFITLGFHAGRMG